MIRTKIREQEIGKEVPDYAIRSRFGNPQNANELINTLLSITDPLLLRRTADLYFRENLSKNPEQVKELCEHPQLEELVSSSADGPLLRFARNYPSFTETSGANIEHLYELLIKRHASNPTKMLQIKAGILNLINCKAALGENFGELKKLNDAYDLVDLVDVEFMIDQQIANKESKLASFTVFRGEEHLQGYYNAFQLFLSPEESFEKLQNYALKNYVLPYTFARFTQRFDNKAELLKNFINKLGEHKHYTGIIDILKVMGHENVDLSNKEVRKAITSEIAKDIEESEGQVGMKGLRREYNGFCGGIITQVDYTGSKLTVYFTDDRSETIEWARCGERSSNKVRFTNIDDQDVAIKTYGNGDSAHNERFLTKLLNKHSPVLVPKYLGSIKTNEISKNYFERIHGKSVSRILRDQYPEDQVMFLSEVLDDYERLLEFTEKNRQYIEQNTTLGLSPTYVRSRLNLLKRELAKPSENFDPEKAKILLEQLEGFDLYPLLNTAGDALVPSDLRSQNIILAGENPDLASPRYFIDHEQYMLSHPVVGCAGLLYCPYTQLSEEVIERTKEDIVCRFGGVEHVNTGALLHSLKVLRADLTRLNKGQNTENQRDRVDYLLGTAIDLMNQQELAMAA